jgi:hypothetical protein
VDGGVDRRHDHFPDALRREPEPAAAAAASAAAARRRRSTWLAVDAFELDGARARADPRRSRASPSLLALLSPRVLAESGRRLALGAAAIGALALVSFRAAWVLPTPRRPSWVAAFGGLLVAVRDRGCSRRGAT